jgi:hypothetical protein
MRNPELNRQFQRLNDLFKKTALASGGDIEIQSHWAKYLCVLSAGFLENAIREIYTNFVRRASSEPVANYAISIISKIQNPKTIRFIEIAQTFKDTWGDELEQYVELNGRKEAIDSIMQNRHDIAHGRNSGITVARLNQYLVRSVEVIKFIERQCSR